MQYLISFICSKCRTIGDFVFDDKINRNIPHWRISSTNKIQKNLENRNTKPICSHCGFYNINIENQLHECCNKNQ